MDSTINLYCFASDTSAAWESGNAGHSGADAARPLHLRPAHRHARSCPSAIMLRATMWWQRAGRSPDRLRRSLQGDLNQPKHLAQKGAGPALGAPADIAAGSDIFACEKVGSKTVWDRLDSVSQQHAGANAD